EGDLRGGPGLVQFAHSALIDTQVVGGDQRVRVVRAQVLPVAGEYLRGVPDRLRLLTPRREVAGEVEPAGDGVRGVRAIALKVTLVRRLDELSRIGERTRPAQRDREGARDTEAV